jgi:hypothetical protein
MSADGMTEELILTGSGRGTAPEARVSHLPGSHR